MAWHKDLWSRLSVKWMDYLADDRLRDAKHDRMSDIEAVIAREHLTADALHLITNRIRMRLGVEDEIEDPHQDTAEQLPAGERYLLWAPVIAAMLKEIDEIRGAVWFGNKAGAVEDPLILPVKRQDGPRK